MYIYGVNNRIIHTAERDKSNDETILFQTTNLLTI